LGRLPQYKRKLLLAGDPFFAYDPIVYDLTLFRPAAAARLGDPVPYFAPDMEHQVPANLIHDNEPEPRNQELNFDDQVDQALYEPNKYRKVKGQEPMPVIVEESDEEEDTPQNSDQLDSDQEFYTPVNSPTKRPNHNVVPHSPTESTPMTSRLRPRSILKRPSRYEEEQPTTSRAEASSSRTLKGILKKRKKPDAAAKSKDAAGAGRR